MRCCSTSSTKQRPGMELGFHKCLLINSYIQIDTTQYISIHMYMFTTFLKILSIFCGPWKPHHRPARTLDGHSATTASDDRSGVFIHQHYLLSNVTFFGKKKSQKNECIKKCWVAIQTVFSPSFNAGCQLKRMASRRRGKVFQSLLQGPKDTDRYCLSAVPAAGPLASRL